MSGNGETDTLGHPDSSEPLEHADDASSAALNAQHDPEELVGNTQGDEQHEASETNISPDQSPGDEDGAAAVDSLVQVRVVLHECFAGTSPFAHGTVDSGRL
jgi:hypothetical protein